MINDIDDEDVQAAANRNGFLVVSTLLLVFLLGQYIENTALNEDMLIALGLGLVAYFGTAFYRSR